MTAYEPTGPGGGTSVSVVGDENETGTEPRPVKRATNWPVGGGGGGTSTKSVPVSVMVATARSSMMSELGVADRRAGQAAGTAHSESYFSVHVIDDEHQAQYPSAMHVPHAV